MAPRDPPSDRFLRGKALAEARAREQAETGRLPGYQDYAGRETTRPGPHVDPLDATEDGFPGPLTPVEHLQHEVAQVRAAVIDHGATLAERYALPHTEAWRRLEADLAAVAERVKVCEVEREKRGRWTLIVKWAKGVGAGSVVMALVWAVAMIGDAGAAREASKRDKATAERVIEDVRGLRESFAALEARVQILIARMMQP